MRLNYSDAKKIIERDGLNQLILDIESYEESARDWVLSDESPHAEFCQSFGYGEAMDDVRRALKDCVSDESEVYAIDRALRCNDEQLKAVIEDCCALERVGIYIQHNEIFSVVVGEVEEQLPDEIIERLNVLSDEQRKAIECVAGIKGDYTYINCDYDRFVMVLDMERLTEKTMKLMGERKAVNQSKNAASGAKLRVVK